MNEGINMYQSKDVKTSIEEYLGNWLKTIGPQLRPRTLDQYAQVIRHHINPIIGKVMLNDLYPDDVQELYTSKIEAGSSPATMEKIHIVLHRALAQAVQWGLIDRNPANYVMKPERKVGETNTLNVSQVRELLFSVQGTRYEAIYYLAVTTGLRRGELLGLFWSDLDWANKSINIQRQLQRFPGAGLNFTEPKSFSCNRVISLGSRSIQKLDDHHKRLHKERQLAGVTWEDRGLIFPSKLGCPMDPTILDWHLQSILKRTKLPRIRFQDLRHTSEALMRQLGVNSNLIQNRLGLVQTNLSPYPHAVPIQDDVAEKLEELLSTGEEMR